ncbi:MAG: GNAT family N-acetyltransferase [Chloroflexi bacterium]|nr:GNAT family N-acetyltransferase [Chloroflexota bacterium]
MPVEEGLPSRFQVETPLKPQARENRLRLLVYWAVARSATGRRGRLVERTELRTERLLLRPFAFADVDDVVRYASDEQWSRYWVAAPAGPYTRRDGEEFIARAILDSWETRPQFAIVLGGTVIGGTGLNIDRESRIGELGYAVARSHWGEGIAPEAARAVIDWAFLAYGLEKVFARADARNVQSHRVMEKLGMRREALLRQHRMHGGERTDEVWYGLLRREWKERAP